MARYFFDVVDGALSVIDDEGTELDGVDAAEREARHTVAQLAEKRHQREAGRTEITVKVRDDHGPVLKAALSLSVERPPERP